MESFDSGYTRPESVGQVVRSTLCVRPVGNRPPQTRDCVSGYEKRRRERSLDQMPPRDLTGVISQKAV